jgi:hypothetical protein
MALDHNESLFEAGQKKVIILYSLSTRWYHRNSSFLASFQADGQGKQSTMPKERSHFLAMSHVIDMLEGTPYHTILCDNRQLAYLGSITHDTLYYRPSAQKSPADLANLPDRFHGTRGEDTFQPLVAFARNCHSSEFPGKLVAFLVGLYSHVFLDAEFHPYVYYSTGSIYDCDAESRTISIARHRRLEVLLDMTLCSENQEFPDVDVAGTVAAQEQLLFQLYGQLFGCAVEGDQSTVARAALTAARRQAMLHSLFANRYLGRIAAKLYHRSPPRARTVLGLFYSQDLAEHLQQFRGVLSYKHPVSGETCNTTVSGMLANAAKRTVELCHGILSSSSDINIVFEPGTWGPSLELGAPGLSVREMRYFSQHSPSGT